MAVRLLQDESTVRAMRLFTYSITYVTLLFSAHGPRRAGAGKLTRGND